MQHSGYVTAKILKCSNKVSRSNIFSTCYLQEHCIGIEETDTNKHSSFREPAVLLAVAGGWQGKPSINYFRRVHPQLGHYRGAWCGPEVRAKING